MAAKEERLRVFLLESILYTCVIGDGIGPEISKSVKRIFEANKVPIVWEDVDVTPFLKNGVTTIPDAARLSVNKNKIALKGINGFVVVSWLAIFSERWLMSFVFPPTRSFGDSHWEGSCINEFDFKKVSLLSILR